MRRWLWPLFVLALLAGCGGGGSSGSSAVPIPGSSAPSTGTPPNPGASPSAVPSGKPSANPTATPQPTATPDVAVPSWNGQTIYTSYTTPVDVNGTKSFWPENCPSSLGGYCTADSSSAGMGQALPSLEGGQILCATEMSNNYHIHVYLGIYYDGSWMILPETIGIVGASNPPPAEELYAQDCFYYLHTHDSTGIVHVEDPDTAGTSIVDPARELGDLFTIWGISVNRLAFGPLAGPVTVFTSGQVFRGGGDCSGTIPPPGYAQSSPVTPESDLTVWSGNPDQIPLYSHEVIWFYIGSGNPTSLPNVSFDEEC